MILDEFNSMCLDIVDNEFPVREIPIMYNYSMRLQVSEINSDKPFNMLFPEFLEAFCRVIDKYSPFPIDQVKVKQIHLIRTNGASQRDKNNIYQSS